MLYLVRHGETEWNRAGRQQGRGDSPLTSRGIRQAQACASLIAADLAPTASVRVLTSPMGRARATADVISRRLALVTDSTCECAQELAEHDWGEWEGLSKPEIDLRYPGALNVRASDHWNYEVPGGESYSMVDGRVRPWLERLDRAMPTVLVTHDMVSRVIRRCALGLSPHEALMLTHPHHVVFRISSGEVVSLGG